MTKKRDVIKERNPVARALRVVGRPRVVEDKRRREARRVAECRMREQSIVGYGVLLAHAALQARGGQLVA